MMEQDQIHACHYMSLPIASQNTRYCLQAGYGLAYAVASAEMALLWGHCLCGSILLRGVFCGLILLRRCLCGSILLRRAFCGSIMRGRLLCGSILLRCCLCGLIMRGHLVCSSIMRRRRLCGSIGVFAAWPWGFNVFAVWLALWLDLAALSSCEMSPLQFNLADSISLWCNYDLHFVLPLWLHVLFLPQWLRLCMSPFSITIMNFCVTPFNAIMIFCIISTDLRKMRCFRVSELNAVLVLKKN
jgi:hypothetical protein